MNKEQFLSAYNESRNGANQFYKHAMVGYFHYSDGVRDCATAGAYWLIDLLAFEAPKRIRKAGETLASVKLTVKNGKAKLVLSGSGDVVFYTKRIEMTDMPEGEWNFLIADEAERMAMILLTEY